MADKKTALMAQFYEQCQQKGYTDMQNDVQSLKAKVIATDLRLNYKDIIAFYNKAKQCYEQVQAEKAAEEKLRQIQKQKEAEESRRCAVDGVLLVTLSDRSSGSTDAKIVRVYMRPDSSKYFTLNGGTKQEGTPTITVEKAGAVMLTYHPSKAVYTGATVGGVTTGGVHHTQPGYTASKTNSGTGEILIDARSTNFALELISFSDYSYTRFKRDSEYRVLSHNNEIKCWVESTTANAYLQGAILGGVSYQTRMNAISAWADERRLSYEKCVRIAELLGRVIHGQFPPTDEEIYAKADKLSNAATSAELKQALELFKEISDFRDARHRAENVSAYYEAVLQSEKEHAVLAKEAKAKKNKRIGIIALAVLIPVIIAGSVILINSRIKAKEDIYNNAVALMDMGQYDEAVEAFAALDGYKDSADQIQLAEDTIAEMARTAELDESYQKALDFLEVRDYEEAYAIFQQLGNYRNAKEYLDRFQDKFVLSTETQTEDGQKVYDKNYEYDRALMVKETVFVTGIRPVVFYDYNPRPNHPLTAEYDYDAAGNNTEIRLYEPDGHQIHTLTYQYDSKGNVLQETSTGSNHVVISRYEYDEKGNLTREKQYLDYESVSFYDVNYVYDEYNQLILEERKYEGGDSDTITYRNEYNSQNRLIKQIATSSGTTWGRINEFEYDDSNNVTFHRSKLTHLDWIYEYIYEYDEWGNKVKEIYTFINNYASGDTTERITTYAYEQVFSFE